MCEVTVWVVALTGHSTTSRAPRANPRRGATRHKKADTHAPSKNARSRRGKRKRKKKRSTSRSVPAALPAPPVVTFLPPPKPAKRQRRRRVDGACRKWRMVRTCVCRYCGGNAVLLCVHAETEPAEQSCSACGGPVRFVSKCACRGAAESDFELD